jgi:transglutaminase-like putative cysteine protease
MRRAVGLLASLSALCLLVGSTSSAMAFGMATRPRLAIHAEEAVQSPKLTEASAPIVTVTPQSGRAVLVTTTLTVANRSADPVRKLDLVIPPTVLNGVAGQQVLNVTFQQEPTSVRQTPEGLEATYLIPEVKPGQVLTFTQTYTVALGEGATAPVTAADPEAFLKPEPWIESDNPLIKAKATELTAGKGTAEARASALLQFTAHYLQYDFASRSRNRGALAALQSGDGVCSEYASLFVALARASGIPARLVYGWANDAGLTGSLESKERHAWAEYYLQGRGWVEVDPTFASVLPVEQAGYFDPQAHLAQGWTQSAHSASYAGLGILSIFATHQLTTTPAVASR